MFFHVYQNHEIIDRLLARADAVARIFGSEEYRTIRGTVSFYQMADQVLVQANLIGLPDQIQLSPGGKVCGGSVLGFHIHAGDSCGDVDGDPFSAAGSHYDSVSAASDGADACPHPYHAGDLPPLFVNNGTAFMVVATNRFTVEEVLGRTVIIHAHPDDFQTQPAGDAGMRIACGIIRG